MIDIRSALRLYLVADVQKCQRDPLIQVDAAIRGGVTMVQLRAKHLSDLETLGLAISMRQLCHRHRVPFLVNDRVDIAVASNADGVHLGVDDLPLENARRIGGDNFTIGYSPESDEQISSAGQRGADYLGIGPVYTTSTKNDAGQTLGPDLFGARVSLTDLPVVGIGGISETNFKPVLDAGAAGIAVVSAILHAADAEAAARQLSRN